jgi:excisionase family DNA binding protein
MARTKPQPAPVRQPTPPTNVPATPGVAVAPAVNGPPGEVLTLSEAAVYLRLPEGAVINAVHSQGLPARFVGGEWRFLKPAIQQWLSSGSPTPETRKAAQLALAGKYKDDPDLMRIGEEANRERGRPLTEDE